MRKKRLLILGFVDYEPKASNTFPESIDPKSVKWVPMEFEDLSDFVDNEYLWSENQLIAMVNNLAKYYMPQGE